MGMIQKTRLFLHGIKEDFFPKKGSPAYEGKKELQRIGQENQRKIRELESRKKKRNLSVTDYQAHMQETTNVMEIENLHTYFYTDIGTVKAVDGVTFAIPKGKTIGVVGESGCGKSVTSLSIMGLVQGPSGQIVEGKILYNNGLQAVDLLKIPVTEMQRIRGSEIAMIFQEPMTSLNPVFTIGYQIDETILLHNPALDKRVVKARSIEMLKLVGIARPEGIYSAYPHELSGGMRQRVMIAIALACDPKLIIADEPTTALDVTIQAQILDLLRALKEKVEASIMLITHDLGVVAEMADHVVVMYAGRIVEQGSALDIYQRPLHPYTVGLLNSKPAVNKETERLYSIPGQVPNPINMPAYCYFKDRCSRSLPICSKEYPPTFEVRKGHHTACWLYEKEVESIG